MFQDHVFMHACLLGVLRFVLLYCLRIAKKLGRTKALESDVQFGVGSVRATTELETIPNICLKTIPSSGCVEWYFPQLLAAIVTPRGQNIEQAQVRRP